MKKLLLLLIFCIPLSAQAVTYSFGSGGFLTPSNPPPCSGGSWSRSGSVFTCTGRVILGNGDEVYVSTGFFEGLDDITVVANNGFQLTNNVIGTSDKNINLQSGYGSIIASGSNTIVGNVSSADGSINLTNTTIVGDVTTQSTLTMTGGSVSGDIVARNGVSLTNTEVDGAITAATGSIQLNGGRVNGLVTSSCCTVTSNGTNLLGGARSNSSSINITGGILQGDFYAANNPATFTGVTMLSGTITGASKIDLTDSRIGSPTGTVIVTAQSGAITLENTGAYGDFTAPSWSTVNVDGNSFIIGSCIPGSTPASACQATQPLTCIDDSLNSSAFSENWVSSRFSGNFTPALSGSRLLLTQDVGYQSPATTLQRWFPADNNLIEIEFDHYAWSRNGGRGADGIAVVLSDATVTPQAGSFGGSLGYAQRDNGDNVFSGGWLGIALDEFGNFSNARGGRQDGDRIVQQSVSVRGSGTGLSGYRYITGTGTLSPSIDRRNSQNARPGYRYRIVIDARANNTAYVSVQRSTNNGNSYTTLIQPINVADEEF